MIKQALLIATIATSMFTAGLIAGYRIGNPNCQEDEVYAVQHDPNPNNGLTWPV